ncbi:MAG: TCR/Tet family MFS transporter [Rhodobacteraceae bacterium]|nr:TCR/Tet family MFS transporter [Paracoccaceae bacterium]
MRLPVTVVLGTILLDAIGIGLILPVMPGLVMEVTGQGLAQAALWGGLLTTSFAIMQFLFGPVLGNLSDAFGRRPVILASLAVMAVDYVVMGLAHTIWLLLAARIVAGIAASTHATAMAFMADISRPEEKSANFGLIGAAFGLGFVLGPALGGLLGEFGTRAPFYAAAVLAGLNLILGIVVLPETLARHNRRSFSWRRANPLGALRGVRSLPGLGPVLVVFFLGQVAFYVYPMIWAYYGRAQFDWGPGMIGVSLATFGIAMAAVQGGLIRVVVARVGDRVAVLAGLAANAIALLGFGLAQAGWMVFALIPFAALGGLTGPALQGIMSRLAPDDRQGELQGVLSSASALATILSPLIMTSIFNAFAAEDAVIRLAGAPFLLSLVLVLICAGLFAASRAGRAQP